MSNRAAKTDKAEPATVLTNVARICDPEHRENSFVNESNGVDATKSIEMKANTTVKTKRTGRIAGNQNGPNICAATKVKTVSVAKPT
ncbi:hypothetical protein FOA43_001401 [Brettanomyces nanus]|uniref:Uncharacterized protein n=1 Tax=Eeniella nana TaxID=13502 RepID=A0A875RNS0_EENNA|nr:uncharacterized protein FOA43_001401 [Brettanomyces nanus]QPG74080.1 hypothetical protein FOA43_001401 [Brettanomyces nanus]